MIAFTSMNESNVKDKMIFGIVILLSASTVHYSRYIMFEMNMLGLL